MDIFSALTRWGFLSTLGFLFTIIIFFQNCAPPVVNVRALGTAMQKQKVTAKAASLVQTPGAPTFEYIKSVNFENSAVGPYLYRDLQRDFDTVDPTRPEKFQWLSVVPESATFGGKSLRIRVPQGKVATESGGPLRMRIPAYDDMCVSLKLKVDPYFDDSHLGKLFGLCGGDCNSQGSLPNGYDGWSARLMWAHSEGPGSSLLNYIYHVGMSSPWGATFGWKKNRKPVLLNALKENWQIADVCVKLNDVDKFNGVVRGYYNDTLVSEVRGLELRKRGSIQVDQFMLSIFSGSLGTVPRRDSYVYIDEISFYRRFDW